MARLLLIHLLFSAVFVHLVLFDVVNAREKLKLTHLPRAPFGSNESGTLKRLTDRGENDAIETYKDSGCPLKLPTDVPKNEPVYLEAKKDGSYQLYVPTGKDNFISSNKALVLLCPGSKNSLSSGNVATDKLTCQKDRFSTEISKVNCTKQVSGELMMTQRQCGEPSGQNRGTLALVGFNMQEQFIELFGVCYNSKTASAIYSYHTLHGKVIKHSVKESKRISFKTHGTPKQAKVDQNYRTATQTEHFNEVLGSNQGFISSKSFLSRGHLAPDADFIFASGQFATYFYVNAHPQFQAVNAGNWLRVESITRNIAADFNEDLTIYTGVHEILKLPNNKGDLVELYLTNDKLIEVPKWTWKVVKSEKKDAAIVFISLNDPFANKNEIVEFCPNVCKAAGIDTKGGFETTRKGYTFCCSLTEFRKVVKTLPVDLKAKNLLQFNSKV